jgi:Tol biopolymer transport system component
MPICSSGELPKAKEVDVDACGGAARLAALAALFTVLVTIAFASTSFAAFPGKNGKIAFEGKPLSIHTIRPDGSHKRRLTRSGREPSFSANGKKIAFERRGDIWVMRANGSHKKRLTRGAASDYSPSFSPSGKRIVFARLVFRNRDRNDLYTIRRDGTHLKRLTHIHFVGRTVFGPQFSPNGRSIVFTHGLPFKIAIMRSNGSHRHFLTEAPGGGDLWPDFSPSGRRIVFQRSLAEGSRRSGAIYVMRRNGTHLRSIGSRYGSDPAFSPSGKRIVFARRRQGSDWGLFTTKLDGSALVGPLTNRNSQTPSWGVRPR